MDFEAVGLVLLVAAAGALCAGLLLTLMVRVELKRRGERRG